MYNIAHTHNSPNVPHISPCQAFNLIWISPNTTHYPVVAYEWLFICFSFFVFVFQQRQNLRRYVWCLIIVRPPCLIIATRWGMIGAEGVWWQVGVRPSTPGRLQKRQRVDCYTVLTWWYKDCQIGMRHGLRLVYITVLWLVGLNIGRLYPSRCGLGAHVTGGNFTTDSPLAQQANACR